MGGKLLTGLLRVVLRPRIFLLGAPFRELAEQTQRELCRRAVIRQSRQLVVDAAPGLFPEDDDVRHLRDDQIIEGDLPTSSCRKMQSSMAW